MARAYDLVIVGLGPAGLTAARLASQELGLRVAACRARLTTNLGGARASLAPLSRRYAEELHANFGISFNEISLPYQNEKNIDSFDPYFDRFRY